MAEMSAPENRLTMRGQFSAIARLRWDMFTHSLSTARGRMEMVSWIFMGFGYFVLAVCGTIGLAVLTWYLVSHDRARWLALPLWAIFLFWQLFPVMATAFTESFDASNFLRFPLTYRAYFIIRMAYGALDPTTILGCVWLSGIALGAAAASPFLLPWTAFVLAAFAASNFLLSRMIFSWIDRWLARRKSREILFMFFFLFIISVQFISPLMNYYTHHYRRIPQPQTVGYLAEVVAVQRFFPPGLASSAISEATEQHFAYSLGAFVAAAAYAFAFFALLNIRLAAQYHGENLGESAAPLAPRAEKQPIRAGWDVSGVSGAVAAMLEKEFRYLSRAGPMLFPLVMPLVILLIMRFSIANARASSRFLHANWTFAFPIGAAYALLILSGVSYNCFGAESGGVQFYYMSPVPFREIMMAKNLSHGAILAVEMILLWIAVAFLFRPPSPSVTLATLAGAAFGALVSFIAGNLMSLYAPKKIDWSALGKQRASNITGLVVLGVQAFTMGVAGIAILTAIYSHRMWPAIILLLFFAAAAFRGYTYVLGRIDALAIKRRENVIAEVCRA